MMETLRQIIDLNKEPMPENLYNIKWMNRFGTITHVSEYCGLNDTLILRSIFVSQKPFCRLEMN